MGVCIKTTRKGKKFQRLVLSINIDRSKNKPCIVFKGKGKSKDGKLLQKREDIMVFFSDNRWMNDDLTA